MTGEPTAPVPIPDLLAAIDRIEKVERGILQVGIDWRDRDLIVRGVRDLAARVETLTGLLSEYGRHAEGCSAPYGYRCRCGWDRESAAALEGDPALAGQSTTEQP